MTANQLPGRPAFDAALDSAMGKEEQVALLLIDLDGFDQLNKECGHAGGDAMLDLVAGTLVAAAPTASFRVSGDEFAVLISGSTIEQAFLSAERIRAAVQQESLNVNLSRRREVTITVGVAHFPRDAKDAQELLTAAEAALHSAKENGGNQVALAPMEQMVMKSCYYPAASVRKLKQLAEAMNVKESKLLREALADLVRKYDREKDAKSRSAETASGFAFAYTVK